MTHSLVKTPLVAFFIALVKVSDGHIMANFQPESKILEMTHQLENLKQQYEDAHTNFQEHQVESAKEAEDLRNEIDQLGSKLHEATFRRDKMQAAAEKRKQGYELLLQVANDEKLMYDTKLQQCSSGKNPKSFSVRDPFVEPPSESGKRDNEITTTEMLTLIPGVRGPNNYVATVKPTFATTLPTTTPYQGETMPPPLSEGVWHNPAKKAQQKCGSVIREIKQSNDTLKLMENDREETIRKLGEITHEIEEMSSSFEEASKERDKLLAQREKSTTLVNLQQNKTAEAPPNKQARKPK